MGFKPNLSWLAALSLAAVSPALGADGTVGAARDVVQARAQYRAGDQFGAVERARTLLATYPDDPDVLVLAGQLRRDAAGPIAALPLLTRAVAARPSDVALLGELAATLGEAGQHRAMLRTVREIARIDPTNRRARLLEATLAARAGQDTLARRLLPALDDFDAAVPAELWLGAVLALRTGNPAQAVDMLDVLVRRQPDNLAAAMLLGRALLANGEASEAIARLVPIADRGDASPYLLTLIGRALEQVGDRARAAAYLDRAASPAPSGAWALLPTLGVGSSPGPSVRAFAGVAQLRALAGAGRVGEAEAAARELTARFPGSADIARAVGDVHLLAGRNDAALASYRRAAGVRADAALVQRLAVLERLRGGNGTARALLAERLRLNPRERSSALLLAQLEAQDGKWHSALALLDFARAQGGPDARLYTQLAEAHLALGERDAALNAARRAHRLQRGSAQIAQVLAQARAAPDAVALAQR